MNGGRPQAIDVARVLRELNSDERRLIAYRYFEDFTQGELAKRLDLPEGTVKVRLHRLRARLRERLEEGA